MYKLLQVQAKNIDTTGEQVLKIAELQNRIMDSMLKINKKIDELEAYNRLTA